MGRKPSGTPALVVLQRAAVRYVAHEYEHDPDNHQFGLETVAKLRVNAETTFKTLIADLDGGAGGQVCAVVPVTGHLDLKSLAAAAGAKRASMTDPARAERLSGYVVGGISPLGQKKPLPTYIDDSARRFATILVSGGRRRLSVELAPGDLADLLGAGFARLRRD